MDTGAIIVIVFVVLCTIALWAGVMYAIWYDSQHPNWYKRKDNLHANVQRQKAGHSTDA